MKSNILKKLVLSGFLATSYVQAEVIKNDLASTVDKAPKQLLALKGNSLSPLEVEYLVNTVKFVPDVYNECEKQTGKCTYYITPNINGDVKQQVSNINLIKSESEFNMITSVLESYDLYASTSNNYERLSEIQKEFLVIEMKLSSPLYAQKISELEKQKADLEIEKKALESGIPESMKRAFEKQLRYSLPATGVLVNDTDKLEDLLNHVSSLKERKVGQVFLNVRVGYSKKEISLLKKLKEQMNTTNDNVKFEFLKPVEAIDVESSFNSSDELDVIGDMSNGSPSFMSLKAGSKISPNGGVVVLDLSYDAVRYIEHKAKYGKAITFPLIFKMHYDFDIKADASVSCKFTNDYEAKVKQMAEVTRGERGVIVVPTPTITKPKEGSGDISCVNSNNDPVSEALYSKMQAEIDDFKAEARADRDDAKLRFESWNSLITNFQSLNGKEVIGEAAFEKVQLFQDKCEVVMRSRSSSGFLGIGGKSSSSPETLCWRESYEEIKKYYKPVEFSLVNEADYTSHINRTFNYEYKGYDKIRRTFSPNFSFCTKLNAYGDSKEYIEGIDCSYDEKLNQ